MTLLDSITAALERAKRATTEAPLREAQRAAQTALAKAHWARVAAERDAPKTVPEASLTEARAAAKLAVLEENVGDYAGAFRSAWQALSSLDKADKRYIPPFFETESRLEVVNEIAWRVQMLHYSLLCSAMGKSPGNRSAFILTGPRGIGKTIILQGVAAVLAVIAPHMIVVRHEITEDPATWLLPTELLQRAARPVMREAAFDSAVAAARAEAAIRADYNEIDLYTDELPRQGYYCALLIDEVQLLYDAAPEHRQQAVKIIGMLARFGKNSNTLAIVTGSSNNTRALLHKEEYLAAKHAGFANLNDSVFRPRIIKPIRVEREMKNVLRPYGKEGEALTVFWATGGIAGGVEKFTRGEEGTPEHDFKLAESLQADPALERVVYNLIPATDTQTWALPAVDERTVQFYLKVFNELEKGMPDVWLDRGFLMRNNSGSYELAQPSLIPSLRARLKDGYRMERFALEATLSGWDRSPSAGHLNERYVLRRVAEEELLGDELRHPQWNARKLRFDLTKTPKRVVLESIGAGAPGSNVEILPAPGHPGELKGLLGELLNSFAGERGIDGLVFTRDPQKDETIHVDLIQVKTGLMSKSINVRAMKGIMARADAGWTLLVGDLEAVFGPRYSFTRRSFTLITNKTIEEPARAALVLYQQPFPGSAIIDQKSFLQDILDDDLRTRVNSLLRGAE
jgi:hypothetical protein